MINILFSDKSNKSSVDFLYVKGKNLQSLKVPITLSSVQNIIIGKIYTLNILHLELSYTSYIIISKVNHHGINDEFELPIIYLTIKYLLGSYTVCRLFADMLSFQYNSYVALLDFMNLGLFDAKR